ncbi:Para-aminobenzoate synthase [Propionibacterium freudenreichii]|nr:Para-aminobenzoate synthase [Propionibacterium freudenreichii]CEI24502.1 Para-aminobenzoate synthase [Propionibacterium freudenreichii]
MTMAHSKHGPRLQLHVRSVRPAPGASPWDVEALFRRLSDGANAAFWLDSAQSVGAQSAVAQSAVAQHVGPRPAGTTSDRGRFSLLGTDAGDLSEVLRYCRHDDAGHTRLQRGHGAGRVSQTLDGDILDVLAERLAARPIGEVPEGIPFAGGYIGYLGYEAKALVFPDDPTRHSPTPEGYWLRPQATIVIDHATNVAHLLVLTAEGDDDAAGSWFGRLEDVLGRAGTTPSSPVPSRAAPTPTAPTATPPRVAGSWRLTRADYEEHVRRAQDFLRAGDSYEVCLTDTFEGPYPAGVDALELYGLLRRINPAPYAAYLRFDTFGDHLEVLSASPEQFLKVRDDGLVSSKPIKGTAPRSADPAEDQRLAAELAADLKSRAENLMIADLLRNDLGRVCVTGSIRVPALMQVESYATVHQLVTTVQGMLRDDVDLVGLLRATFPGGSMTGAPKQRTLQIIDALEPGPRGIYSGALGYLGYGRRAELSIVIRTIVRNHDRLSIGAGGAIVLDSQAPAEFDEKELKAAALLRALRRAGAPAGRPAPYGGSSTREANSAPGAGHEDTGVRRAARDANAADHQGGEPDV